jgi:hypothetical protein
MFTGSFLAYAVVGLMMPEMDRMVDAKSEMCSGFTEFSYTMTSMGHPAWYPAEASVDEALFNLRQSRRYWILRMVIDSNNIAETETNQWVSILKAGGYKSTAMVLVDVQDATNDQTLELCEDLAKYCNQYHLPGPSARLYCPAKCGCDHPGSSLAIATSEFGCPMQCAFDDYKLFFTFNRSCVQPLSHELTSDPHWIDLMGHWAIATSRWESIKGRQFGIHFTGMMLKWGCFAALILDWEQYGRTAICAPVSGLKSVAFWCPAACACNYTDLPSCPRSCVFRQPVPTQSIAIEYVHPYWGAD